jgi:hypothetical protein
MFKRLFAWVPGMVMDDMDGIRVLGLADRRYLHAHFATYDQLS